MSKSNVLGSDPRPGKIGEIHAPVVAPKPDKMFRVLREDGTVTIHKHAAARDLENRGCRILGPAAASTAPVEAAPVTNTEPEIEDDAVIETVVVKPTEPDELDLLRAQAEKLGVKVDARWGKKKLQEAIDEVTA